MKTSSPVTFALGVAVAALAILVSGATPLQEMPSMSTEDMAAMMEKVTRYTQPGEQHALLERFLGEWETETRFGMVGQWSDPAPGHSTGRELLDGRWVALEGAGTMMGMPVKSLTILGYDNFKQSFVSTMVSTMDTAMNHAEGDLTPDGRSLVSYGTLDEYLTGEHDKMVKYAWRFVSDDELVLEVHDLPIGETGTQVVEVRFRRAQ